MPPANSVLSFVTPASWATAQAANVAELLVEQAHLEKKAAAAAVALLFRIGLGADVHRELSALAREELVHFERTLRLLAARSIPLRPLPPSGYAEKLKGAIATVMPQRLVDELLVAAIIEARSCERMALLGESLLADDPEVAAFYRDLCEAEARHQSLYVDLAQRLAPAGDVARRCRELAAHEAAVLQALPFAPRLHSGLAVRGNVSACRTDGAIAGAERGA